MKYEKIILKTPDERLSYTLKQIKVSQEVWVLVDDDGCVFLADDEEDCVPIWPHKELAMMWAIGDWQHCEAKSINVEEWSTKWTSGLISDDINVAVCPNPDEVGVILFPDEFEYELNARF